MRDLDRAGAHRQQPAVREDCDDARDVVVALPVELGERDAAAHDRAALALTRKPQQDVVSGLLLGRLQAAEGVLGQARHGAVNAARSRIGRQLQAPAAPLLPQLQKGRRQQRKRARLPVDVGDEGRLRGPRRRAARLARRAG